MRWDANLTFPPQFHCNSRKIGLWRRELLGQETVSVPLHQGGGGGGCARLFKGASGYTEYDQQTTQIHRCIHLYKKQRML